MTLKVHLLKKNASINTPPSSCFKQHQFIGKAQIFFVLFVPLLKKKKCVK